MGFCSAVYLTVMNIAYKIFIIFIVLQSLCGCATNRLLDHSGKTENLPTVQLDKYIKGIVTKENIALLCFEGKTKDLDSNAFTVKLDLNSYIERFNKDIHYYKQSGHLMSSYIRFTQEHVNVGCNTLPNGKKITKYNENFVHNKGNWGYLSNNHKNISLFIPAQNNQGSIIYLSLNDDMHIALSLQPNYYEKDLGCTICYAGLPFTFVFDVITFPFQVIGYYIISTGMRH